MVDLLPPYRKLEGPGSRLRTPLPKCRQRLLDPGLERLNVVLRQRNRREVSPPPTMAAQDKYSKFSQLPAIKPRGRPKLLREKTYDVLEPIYVKGPPQEDKIKLPDIKKADKGSKTTMISGSPRRATSRGGQLITPKRNKAPDTNLPVKVKRQPFKPNSLPASDEVPNNVFWFPM